MDRNERHQKSQPFQSLAKNLAGIFVLLGPLSCSHKPTNLAGNLPVAVTASESSSMDVSALGIQLTKIGDNLSPALSTNGKKIVYISRKRPSHPQGQVYLYDLENLKERRITYQDGECEAPILLSDDHLVYASTTDELKERPLLLRKNSESSPYPPTDLYLSDLSGDNILRLTKRNGFDGFPKPLPDQSGSILFSEWTGKALEILQLNLKTQHSQELISKKEISILSAALSPDLKQSAWIEKSADTNPTVMLSNGKFSVAKQKILPLPKGDYRDLIWASNQKIIFSSKSIKKYYQLYSYELTTNCLQSLFESNSDLSSPQLSPDGKALVFASFSNGSSQIFYKTLPTPSECLKWDDKN